MSDIRLVNVVPIVNGWNDAAKKNLEEAKTLMASGNHLDYNKGVVCGNESCEHYQPSGSYMLPPTCAINGCCLSKPPQSWCYVAETEEDDAL